MAQKPQNIAPKSLQFGSKIIPGFLEAFQDFYRF